MKLVIYKAHPGCRDRWGVNAIWPAEIACPLDNRPIVRESKLTNDEIAALKDAGVEITKV